MRRLVFLLFFGSASLFSSSFRFNSDVWDIDQQRFEYFSLRPQLAKKGIYFLPYIIFDWNWPAHGGIKTSPRPLYQYLLEVQFGIDLEKLICLKGGRAFINFQYHQGEHPTENYVGDIQGFDNINSPNLAQMGELWYEQFILDQKLGVRLGKIDAYTLFSYTGYAQVLINNSFSQIPTILAFPSYPDQAVGVVVLAYPTKWFSPRVSIFDGSNAVGVQTGAMGSRNFFNHLGNHALIMGEAQFSWGTLNDQNPGQCGVGVWGLTATLPNFNGGFVHGTAGSYFYLSQTVWKEHPYAKRRDRSELRELGAFLQWGIANKEIWPMKQYFGVGLASYNLTRTKNDALSIGAATVLFSNATGADYPKLFEMALEATYSLDFFGYFQVQPDFQYIIHPGGQGLKNEIVATLRLVASI